MHGKTQFRFLAMAILAALALTLAVTLPGVSADGGEDEGPSIPEKRELKYPNLGSHLDQLVARVEDEEMSEGEAAGQAAIHEEELVAVTIHLSGSVDEVVEFLEDNGGDPRNVGEDYIEAYVPVTLLGPVSEQPGVIRVREIVPPEPAYGPITSQGVQAHATAAWHQAGITGKGVKVGIIDVGFEGFGSLMGTELPTTVVAMCYTDIGVLTGNLSDCENEEVHGTAVAEAVMDIAPGVSLYIANPESKADLRSTVDWMASEGVTVINVSVGWLFDGPGNGTSPDSVSPLNTVDRAVDGGITWISIGHNHARTTWFKRAPYLDADSNDCIEFATRDEVNGMELVAGQPIRVQLRWADSWGGATSDLDLYLQTSRGLVASSEDLQSGGAGHNPFELIVGMVRVSGLYGVAVCHYGGSMPDWIQVVVWDVGSIEHYTGEGSITNPGESAKPGMLAVGATHYWDTHTIADYSSRGPTPDGRVKPDIVGTACGKTASYELKDPERFGNDCWFPGTSQAAPHVAGMAALVRQRFPDYTPQQVAAYLKDHAERRGTVPNNTWGYGFAVLPAHDAVAAKPPGPPAEELTATANGETRIDLSWNAPASNGGAAITGYRIEVSADGSNWSDLVADTNSTGTTYSHTGLTLGDTRHYRVSAINPAGTGPASNIATATTGSAPPAMSSDLVVDTPTVSDGSPDAGASFTLSVTVRNRGNGPADSTTLRYYRSTDSAITTGDTAVGTDPVGGLAASESRAESISLTAPSAAGTYYYGACVDAVTDETNTSNNCSDGVMVTVRAAPAEREALVALYEATGGSNWYNNRNWLSNAPLGDWYGVDTDADGGVTSLNLRRNGLTGEIPPELGDLTSLESLHLHDNDLSGCVPVALRGVAVRGARLPFCDALAGGVPAAPAWIKYEHIDVPLAPDHVNVWWAETPGAYWYQTGKLGEVDAPATKTIDGETCGFIFEFFCGGPPYKVRACNADGCSDWTHTLPLSPADVQYQRDGSTIVVSWSSVTNADHYKVYHHNSDSSSCRLDSSGNPSSCEELTGAVVGTSFTHTNPDENANYYWVVACNSAGCSEIDSANPATFVGGPPAPASPPNQRYVWQGSTTVVSWDAVSGADHYTVYYDDFFSSGCSLSFGGSPSFCDELATNIRGTSYTHTSPDEDDNYYWVVACNSGGCSEIDSANPARFIDTRPGSPTNQRYVWQGATTVVSWDAVSGADHYTVYYDDFFSSGCSLSFGGSPSFCDELATNIRGTSYTHTSPDEDDNYYWVVACNSGGCSDIDSANSARFIDTRTPDLVVDTPTVSDDSPDAGERFTLRATVRNQGNGSSDSTTLRYYRSTDVAIASGDAEVDSDFVFGLDPSETSNESAGLTAPSTGGTYYYGACVDAVSAESDTGNNCSTAVTVTVGAAPAPDLVVDAPTVSDGSPDAGASFTLSVTVRNQGNGPADSTTLRYYRSTDSAITTGDTAVGTDPVGGLAASESRAESISLTAPSAAGTYYYGACVDAVTDETNTSNNCSDGVTVTVVAVTAPGAPTGLAATASGPTGIDLSWNAPASNGGAAITGYRIEVSADGSNWSDLVADTNSTGTTYSHTGLTLGDTRHYRVSAINPAGTGPASNVVAATTDSTQQVVNPDLVVDAPTVSDGSPDAGASFTLSVTVRNQGNGPADSTTLRYYRSTDSAITTGDTAVGTDPVGGLAASESRAESISLTAPSAAGTYYYGACVDAVTDETNTSNNCSDGVTVTVVAVTAPGAPTGLAATASGPTGIDLSWNAPASNGGAAITGYRIEVSADGSNWSDLVADTNSTGTTYSHTGLTLGDTRHYRVSAINPAGTGPASNVARATTGPTPSQNVSATRSFAPASVSPGGEVVVTITTANYGAFGVVTETLPAGFTYVSSSLPDGQVTEVDARTVRFTLQGNTSFTYTVTASSVEDSYTFSGTLRDSYRNDHVVGGASTVTVFSGDPLVARYDANGNGAIDRSEVIQAINDYLFGEGDPITRAEVIQLINLYLFGPTPTTTA